MRVAEITSKMNIHSPKVRFVKGIVLDVSLRRSSTTPVPAIPKRDITVIRKCARISLAARINFDKYVGTTPVACGSVVILSPKRSVLIARDHALSAPE